jgi:hypothetical protein
MRRTQTHSRTSQVSCHEQRVGRVLSRERKKSEWGSIDLTELRLAAHLAAVSDSEVGEGGGVSNEMMC